MIIVNTTSTPIKIVSSSLDSPEPFSVQLPGTLSVTIPPGLAKSINQYYLAYYNLGLIYYKQKNYKASIENFSITIDLTSEDPGAYYYRSKSYEATGEKEKAKIDLDKYEEPKNKQKQ